jgi:hypothetical protein
MSTLEINVNMGNLQNILGVMVPIVAIIGGLSLAFGIRYLKSKERMEMIARGMDVSALKGADMADAINYAGRRRRSPMSNGLVFLGVGMGLLVSYYLCHSVFTGDDNEVIYFGVIALFVGLALIIGHQMEKKTGPGTDQTNRPN